MYTLGTQLLFNQPAVYEHRIPPSFERLFPTLAKAVAGKGLPKGVKTFFSVADIQTAGGMAMRSFAKHKKFAKGLCTFLFVCKIVILTVFL